MIELEVVEETDAEITLRCAPKVETFAELFEKAEKLKGKDISGSTAYEAISTDFDGVVRDAWVSAYYVYMRVEKRKAA